MADPDLRYCPCGEAWWVLTRTGDGVDPVIALDEVGSVIAYSGVARCASCGSAFNPRAVLSVVPKDDSCDTNG